MSGQPDAAIRQRWARVAREVQEGIAYHRAGHLDRAETIYRRVLNKVPDHPDALHMLGAIANTRGRPERGMQLIRKVLQAWPQIPDAHVNLGNSHVQLGQRAEAIACYRRATELNPALAMAHSSLGRELNLAGEPAAALASCQRAIALDATMPEAHADLGIASWRLGRLVEAEAALARALQLRPDDPRALGALAVVYTEASRFDLARRYRERLVALQPDDPRLLRDLGLSTFRTGDSERALELLRRAVALAPGFAEGWSSLGWALRALGRFDEANDCFRRALAIDPGHAEARRSLAETGVQSADEAELTSLAAQFVDAASDPGARIAAGFARGRLLDRVDRYDEAFAQFAAANALVRQRLAAMGRAYDPAAMAERVDGLIETLTPPLLAALAGAGHESELPVFIVGMPRSGTTLVEQILASHSCVFGAGELNDIPVITQSLPAASPAPETVARWYEAGRSLGEAHLGRLRALGGDALRVIDKLPDNVFHLGTIAALFPRARVILCRRDPRDIGLSNFFQLFAGGNPYAYDLAECGHRCRQVDRLFRHWQSVLTLPMLEVGYEDLVGDLEGQSRRLIEFLDLQWEPRCLDFHRTERVVVTQSTWQVRQPLYDRSVGRWRHYERHLGPLFEALAET